VLTQNPSGRGGGSVVVDFLLRGRYDSHGGGAQGGGGRGEQG